LASILLVRRCAPGQEGFPDEGLATMIDHRFFARCAPGTASPLPRRTARRVLLWAVLTGLVACGGGGGVDKSKAQLRLVNASQSGELALVVNDQVRQGPVAYGQAAGYAEPDSGNATVVVTRSGSSTALTSNSLSLEKGRYYTLLAYGAEGALKRVVLDDNQADPDSGKALLRVVNAATDAGALDLYLTGDDEPLASSVPLQAGAVAGVVNPWLTLGSGGWRLRVTAAGNKADLRLDMQGLSLASRQLVSLVLTPGSGGVLVNALVLTQRGALVAVDNTQARVRVAAALDGGGAVSARVGAVPVFSNTPAPATGLYTLVNAGAAAVALTVAGNTLATPARSLLPGSDQTLLVLGSTSLAAQQAGALPPQAFWLSDDNRTVSDTTQVRLRLVNGLAQSAGTLALTVDFVAVADSVAVGAASPYVSVVPGVSTRLAVVSSSAAAPQLWTVDQALVAGATYSVFLTGKAAAPQAIVRRDR
jgi:Domain of unknown function (DUF4397)